MNGMGLMSKKISQVVNTSDRIVIHDTFMDGPKVLRTVEIINPLGEKKVYKIIKTKNNKYLFN
jgi:hypothetical protein